jgi:hypothetical protein
MNRGVTIELDSYRLAKCSEHVPCLICREGNIPGAETCRNCFAPMILSHQAIAHHTVPIMLAALGPSGVGKTVYLGMLLDMLSRQSSGLMLSACGGFSVTLQQNTLAALGRCEFPSKTPSEPDRWNWVHGQVHRPKKRRPLEVVLPDIAGEALFGEVDRPRSYQLIHWLLSRCDGVFILIDGTKLESGSLDEDFFTMKLLGHLSELKYNPKSPWRTRPVALVISKADQCTSCFEDPAGFARRYAPGLWRICEQRFPKHAYFAAGVAGACVTRRQRNGGTTSIPLRVEPRGVIEPFVWLIENLKL